MKPLDTAEIKSIVIDEEKGTGFALYKSSRVIPNEYSEYKKVEDSTWRNKEGHTLLEDSPYAYSGRVINRIHKHEELNMKPAYVRITDAGTVIIE